MPYNIFTDTGTTFQTLDYLVSHLPEMEIPGDFKHTPPASKPTEPSTAGLDAFELAEVNAWKDGYVTPTLPDAVTYVADYVTYNAAMDAWMHANHLARKTQYRLSVGDALIYNRATEPASSDPAGAGGTPPPQTVFPRNDP